MPIAGCELTLVFPPWAKEFRRIDFVIEELFENDVVFRHWAGIEGGGIVSIAVASNWQVRSEAAQETLRLICREIPTTFLSFASLVFGNAAGERLKYRVLQVTPCEMPGTRSRSHHRIGVTAEHIDCNEGERYLLIVPRTTQKRISRIDRLSTWFSHFGIEVGPLEDGIPASQQEEVQTWFSDPTRPMWSSTMKGGEPTAAWQMAVIGYIAEYWAMQERVLDSIHFLTNIQGRPRFRKRWTSNK